MNVRVLVGQVDAARRPRLGTFQRVLHSEDSGDAFDAFAHAVVVIVVSTGAGHGGFVVVVAGVGHQVVHGCGLVQVSLEERWGHDVIMVFLPQGRSACVR